jgi:hydroxypyruvate isomerase
MSNPLTTRARYGAGALSGYRTAKGESMRTAHPDDQESEVSDAIADLLHYAAAHGFDRARILRCAESNAGAERANFAAATREGLTGADLALAVQG